MQLTMHVIFFDTIKMRHYKFFGFVKGNVIKKKSALY